jgi:alkylation response protein AidB-like acyl-CoA dehydrogenase
VFTLTEDQRELAAMVREFAAELIAPHAVTWDREKHFPVDVLRKAAELGMGGIYVAEEHGGSGLSRLDAALVIEALATGCPSIASYVSIHNMVAWMIDRYGDEEQRARHLPALCAMTT